MNDEVDEPVAPDTLVSTALQMLPVPAHDGTFWTRLDAALDAESGPAAPTATPASSVFADPVASVAEPDAGEGPATVVELVPQAGLVPRSLRRGSNAVLSAVAVAAAVMVVVAGVSLVRDDSGTGGGTDLAATPTSSDQPSDPVDRSDAPDTKSSITGLTGATAEPQEAVAAWTAALAAGDMDTAWNGLTSASQDDWGSKAKFAAERSGFAEGFGAWSQVTPDAVIVTPIPSSGDGVAAVVTLVGTLEQEGTRQHRADAFVVRVVDGRSLLEVDPYSGEIEVVVPEPIAEGAERAVVDADESLVVVLPAGAAAPVIRLDDGEALICGDAPDTELTALEDTGAQRCEYAPSQGMRSGDRVLTVAYMSADGSDVAARSVLFEAA